MPKGDMWPLVHFFIVIFCVIRAAAPEGTSEVSFETISKSNNMFCNLAMGQVRGLRVIKKSGPK